MNVQDFITQEVLGIPLETTNWMCEEFGLDVTSLDVNYALDLCSESESHPPFFYNMGYCLIATLFAHLLEDYGDIADRNDFKLFYYGEDTYMTYKGVRIVSKRQLDEMTGVLE